MKLTESLVRVLHIVDSENKPAMGFFYQVMYKAREEMVRRFQRNKRNKQPLKHRVSLLLIISELISHL